MSMTQAITAPASAKSTQFVYDLNSRLVGYTRTTPTETRSTQYTLDLVGNRTHELETGDQYQRMRDLTLLSGHRIGGFHQTVIEGASTVEDRFVTYDYDANGNRIAKVEVDQLQKQAQTTRMIWDAKNRLRRVDIDGNPSLSMDYDDLGRRIRKVGDDREDAILYVWDELSVLNEFADKGAGPAALSSYAFGHLRLALLRPGLGPQWVSHDLMGSISELTDSNGHLLEAKTFSPFGQEETIFSSSSGGYNRYGFTGHEYDPESGLTYAKARYYDQDLGVFTGVDPVMGQFDTPPSLHRYLYGYHNPNLYTDPTGEQTVGEFLEEMENEYHVQGERAKAGGILVLRMLWEFFGVESLNKVADRFYQGNTDDLTKLDYVFAVLDALPMAGKLAKFLGLAGKLNAVKKLFAPAERVLGKVKDKINKFGADHLGLSAAERGAKSGAKGLETAVEGLYHEGDELADAARHLDEGAEDLAKTADDLGPGSKTEKEMIPEQPKERAKPEEPQSASGKQEQSKVSKEKRGGPESKKTSSHADEATHKQAGIEKAREAKSVNEKARILKEHGHTKQQRRELIENNVVCFVAGTQVVTETGLKPIESIEEGERVLTRDDQTGEQSFREVLETFTTHPDTLYHVLYRNDKGAEQELITTAGHPFWVEEEQDWIYAQDLKPGYTLVQSNGQKAVFLRLELERGPPEQPFTTYNLNVSETHTYYVAPVSANHQSLGIWVHNSGGQCKANSTVPQENRLLKNSSGGTVDPSEFKGLSEHGAPIKVGPSGSMTPIKGEPNTFRKTTGGHVLVYDSAGEIKYDVSHERVKMWLWNQSPNGKRFPIKNDETKYFGDAISEIMKGFGL